MEGHNADYRCDILPHFKVLNLWKSVRKFIYEILNSVSLFRCVNSQIQT
jgi:hypothetical protein